MSKKKIKVLAYMDSPVVQTGFGRVSREILTRLQETGKFDIVVLGLNDRGEYHEQREKFKIIPCPDLKDDPYGYQLLPRMLINEKPDVILALNDIWVFTGFKESGNVDWFKNTVTKFAPGVPVVCYFTIDGRPNAPEWDEFIRWLTVPIVMSDFGEQTVLETAPDVAKDLMKAYHGSSVEYFYPITPKEKREARAELSRNSLTDDDFLITVVSRNQPRKNLPTLIHAFKKFNEGYHICPECGYPNSDADVGYCEICKTPRKKVIKGEYVKGVGNAYLYFHLAMRDARGFKLDKILRDNRVENILFRPEHNIAQGVSVSDLNRIYGAADLFCQPTYAEGYGLPPIEAACAGIPVLATNTTTMVEMFKDGRGELVNADSVMVLADAGHCRKHNISEIGLIEAFRKLYNDPELRKTYGEKGREFALTRTWDGAAKVMEKAIIKAHKKVIQVHNLFDKEKKGTRFLLVNRDGNPENVASIIPLAKALSKKHDNPEIVCITKNRYEDLLDELSFIQASVGARYAESDQETMNNLNIRVVELTNVWDGYARAAFPHITTTADGFYCHKFGLVSDGKFRFKPTAKEKKWAMSMLKKAKNKTKILIGTAGSEENIYPYDYWGKLIDFLDQQSDNMFIMTDMTEIGSAKHDNVLYIHDFTLRQQLVLAKYCDIVVSCDNLFLMFGEYFDGIKIGVSAGRDLKKKYDYEDFTVLAKSGAGYECWPCNRIPGIACPRNGRPFAECASHIRPEQIMSLIAKAIKKRGGGK